MVRMGVCILRAFGFNIEHTLPFSFTFIGVFPFSTFSPFVLKLLLLLLIMWCVVVSVSYS